MGGADQLVEALHLHRLVAGRRGDRHDLLGEDVEGVSGYDRLLDLPVAHQPGDDRALEQVGAELGEDPSAAGLADRVAGATDPLQPAGHRLGRLDLQDEVDGAHVDPELEAAGGHQAGQLAALEHLLDDDPLLAGQRAVVGAGDLAGRRVFAGPLVGQFVEAQGQPLGAAAAVDEDDCRGVLLDEGEDLGVDRRPDRAARGFAAGDRIELGRLDALVGLDHRFHRHVDLQVELLGRAGVDHRHLAARAAEEAADLLERALGGREADPLRVTVFLVGGEPLERDGQVAAALGRRDGVDLVDDHRLDVGERLGGAGGEHQVERLRGGDEDVGRVAPHPGALLLRGVAGADRDVDVGADPPQRRDQVLLDVVGQRLERGDVDDPRAALGLRLVRHPLGDQPVDPPEEGGERLARAGRGADQDVLAAGDRRPGLRLGVGRRLEGPRAPVSDGGSEGGEGHRRKLRAYPLPVRSPGPCPEPS